MNFLSRRHRLIQHGDNHKFSQLEGRRGDGATEGREVVLVPLADLLEETMGPEALEKPRELGAGAFG